NTLQITPLLKRTPKQLSGGQRQRVAIGRAIVRKPQAFLFDEPLSNLDAKLREEMRVELAKLHQKLNTTIIYVTHDQVEAMTLATRIAIIDKGHIQQIGAPEKVFNEPANIFVAGFIGSPTMNFMDGTLKKDGDKSCFINENMKIPTSLSGNDAQAPVTLGIRPEEILTTHMPGRQLSDAIEASIEVVELLGHIKHVHLKIGESKILATASASFPGKPGNTIPVYFDLRNIHIFDKQSGKRIT
ncbi:ABC transporter ATP-binding protein, partial [Elusimicrobiota bacterium]